MAILSAGAVSCRPAELFPATEALEIRAVTEHASKSDAEHGSLPSTYVLCASGHLLDPRNDIDYFKAHKFVHDGGCWKGEPTIYWPISGRISLLCLATEDTGSWLQALTSWNARDASESVRVDVPDRTKLDSELLYGATILTHPGTASTLVMHHSQALLKFTFSSNAADLIRIDRVEIEDAYSGGTLTVDNSGLLSHRWEFSGHEREHRITVPDSEHLVLGSVTSESRLLLPEQQAKRIWISYRRRNYASDSWESAPVVKTSVHEPATAEWLSGNVYEYRLQLDLTETVLTLTLSPWGHSSPSVSTLK